MAEGADEAPFTGGHDHVIFLGRQPISVQIAEGDDPAVRVDDAFGLAGGSGRVDDEGRFVRGSIAGSYEHPSILYQRRKGNLVRFRLPGAHDMVEESSTAQLAHRSGPGRFGENPDRSALAPRSF